MKCPKRTVNGVTYSRKLYGTWRNMIYRCENPRIAAYEQYGARGIRVCDRWHSFADFATDMGEPPTKKHSIDRVNSVGNYEPGNCVWSTHAEQCQNRTLSIARRVITFGKIAVDMGISLPLASLIIKGKTGSVDTRRKTVGFFVNEIQNLLDQGWKATPHRIELIEKAAAECGIPAEFNIFKSPVTTTRPSIAKSFGKRKTETV